MVAIVVFVRTLYKSNNRVALWPRRELLRSFREAGALSISKKVIFRFSQPFNDPGIKTSRFSTLFWQLSQIINKYWSFYPLRIGRYYSVSFASRVVSLLHAAKTTVPAQLSTQDNGVIVQVWCFCQADCHVQKVVKKVHSLFEEEKWMLF